MPPTATLQDIKAHQDRIEKNEITGCHHPVYPDVITRFYCHHPVYPDVITRFIRVIHDRGTDHNMDTPAKPGYDMTEK